MEASSARWHEGNDYEGPGAWKRPQQRVAGARREVASGGPLDLTAFFEKSWGHGASMQTKLKRASGKRDRVTVAKAAVLQARLNSLSLSLAPSHGVSFAPAPAVGEQSRSKHREDRNCPAVAVGSRTLDATFCFPRCPEFLTKNSCRREELPNETSFVQGSPCSGGDSLGEHAQCGLRNTASGWEPRRRSHGNTVEDESNCRTKQEHITYVKDCKKSSGPGPQAPDPASSQLSGQGLTSTNALRIPSPTIKMSVDDRCNAKILDARTALRTISEDQRRLGEDMYRRWRGAILTRGDRPSIARRYGASKEKVRCRRGKGLDEDRVNLATGRNNLKSRRAPLCPLLVMAENDLQKHELDQMMLEDAGATHLAAFEEARRRKLDYAEYFALALRYGPLGEGDFERAIFPGRSYHGNLFDASRLIQTWWWGLWPSILRRRKAAALMIQARFRGHVQRIRWQAIIRLRTMWGYTRIVAHAYTCWRDSVAKIRRAKAFARRLKNRCLARCLAALASLTRERRETRQDIVRERIRRMSLTLRDRVFDAWVLFTEKSLAVKRMRWHSLVYPTFDSWRRKVFRDRSFSRLRWACAVLVGRLMRWKATTRYVRLCKACIKIQRLVRVKLAITRTRNAVRHSRTCRAEEAIQREKDERIHRMLNDEHQRRDRLQGSIRERHPTMLEEASTFLRTAMGRSAIVLRVANMGEQSTGANVDPQCAGNCTGIEEEAKGDVVRSFLRWVQAPTRHDFDATSPPPLRCPRSCCDATFVDPGHYVRHAADLHPADPLDIAKLVVVLHDPVGLAAFESYTRTSDDPWRSRGSSVSDERARTNPGVDHWQRAKPFPCVEEAERIVSSTLGLWKMIEEWRTVPRISSDRYERLTASIVDDFAVAPAGSQTETGIDTISSTSSYLPSNVRIALGDDEDIRRFAQFVSSALDEKSSTLKHFGRRGHKRLGKVVGNSESNRSADGVKGLSERADHDPSPLTLEEASWQALVGLHELGAGPAFLRSSAYGTYTERVNRPTRDAVEVKAVDIARNERAEWLLEARMLRASASLRQQLASIDALAEDAMSRALEGAPVSKMSAPSSSAGLTPVGILRAVIDDQAALLALAIIAERKVFAKVTSSIWNEALDEASYLNALELREVDPTIAEAISEAVYLSARSHLMDYLIDQCVLGLTAPQGDFWVNARPMTAVADGVTYRVRCDVMDDLLEASVSELQESGEAELLLVMPPNEGNHSRGGGDEAAHEAVAGSSSSTLVAVDSATQEEPGTGDPPPAGGTNVTGNAVVAATAHDSSSSGGSNARRDMDGHEPPAVVDLQYRHAESTSCDERDSSSDIEANKADTTSDTEITRCRPSDMSQIEDITKAAAETPATTTTLCSFTEERAAAMVQSAVRRKGAYRKIRAQVARNFVKFYDPSSGFFYWYNQTTAESSWEKPAIIDAYFKKPNLARALMRHGVA